MNLASCFSKASQDGPLGMTAGRDGGHACGIPALHNGNGEIATRAMAPVGAMAARNDSNGPASVRLGACDVRPPHGRRASHPNGRLASLRRAVALLPDCRARPRRGGQGTSPCPTARNDSGETVAGASRRGRPRLLPNGREGGMNPAPTRRGFGSRTTEATRDERRAGARSRSPEATKAPAQRWRAVLSCWARGAGWVR